MNTQEQHKGYFQHFSSLDSCESIWNSQILWALDATDCDDFFELSIPEFPDSVMKDSRYNKFIQGVESVGNSRVFIASALWAGQFTSDFQYRIQNCNHIMWKYIASKLEKNKGERNTDVMSKVACINFFALDSNQDRIFTYETDDFLITSGFTFIRPENYNCLNDYTLQLLNRRGNFEMSFELGQMYLSTYKHAFWKKIPECRWVFIVRTKILKDIKKLSNIKRFEMPIMPNCIITHPIFGKTHKQIHSILHDRKAKLAMVLQDETKIYL